MPGQVLVLRLSAGDAPAGGTFYPTGPRSLPALEGRPGCSGGRRPHAQVRNSRETSPSRSSSRQSDGQKHPGRPFFMPMGWVNTSRAPASSRRSWAKPRASLSCHPGCSTAPARSRPASLPLWPHMAHTVGGLKVLLPHAIGLFHPHHRGGAKALTKCFSRARRWGCTGFPLDGAAVGGHRRMYAVAGRAPQDVVGAAHLAAAHMDGRGPNLLWGQVVRKSTPPPRR